MKIKSWHQALLGFMSVIVLFSPLLISIFEERERCSSWDCAGYVELNGYSFLILSLMICCMTPVLFLGIKKREGDRSMAAISWFLVSFLIEILLVGLSITTFLLPLEFIFSLLIVFFDSRRQMVGAILSAMTGISLLILFMMSGATVEGANIGDIGRVILAFAIPILYLSAGISFFLSDKMAPRSGKNLDKPFVNNQ